MAKRDFNRLETGVIFGIFAMALSTSFFFLIHPSNEALANHAPGSDSRLEEGLALVIKASSDWPMVFEDRNHNGQLDPGEDRNRNGLLDPHPLGVVLEIPGERKTVSFQVETASATDLDPEGDGLIEEVDGGSGDGTSPAASDPEFRGVDYNGDGDRRDVFLVGRMVQAVQDESGKEIERRVLFSGILLPVSAGGDVDGDGVSDPVFHVIRRQGGAALHARGLVVHSVEEGEVHRTIFSKAIPLGLSAAKP